MRVLHVVTLVSPEGEYGGPVRVALNQCKALRDIGVDAVLSGGTRGFDTIPTEVEGVEAKLFPARQAIPRVGFAGLAAPKLIHWLHGALSEFDAVHVHLARDLVTLPAARLAHKARVPIYLQTHGMIDPSPHPLARPLDFAMTRPNLRKAHACFYLTPRERTALLAVEPGIRSLQHLINGVPEHRGNKSREPFEVLFLARLHERKRPLLFVEAARRLAVDFPQVQWTLVGPNEGQGEQVTAAIARAGTPRIVWQGPLAPSAVADRLSKAEIYCLPSVDEPFPMSVLEAMAAATPVIISDSCGLASHVESAHAGHVVRSDDLEDLVEALRALLKNRSQRVAMGHNALGLARSHFTMETVAATLRDAYADGQESG